MVIPTHNRAASLQRLLDVVERSTKPAGGMDVIVVDDGSTDATAAVVDTKKFRYLRQPNLGPAAARERGWRASTGEVVVFLDDDVAPATDTIHRLVSGLDGADAVGAVIHARDRRSLIAHYMDLDGMITHCMVDGEVVWLVLLATAIRREALERIGGFDLTFRPAGEDVDLTSRLLEAGCVLRVDPGAVVGTNCASGFAQLVRALYVYGGGFRMLASRHASFRRERIRSALLRLNPRDWRNRYRHYRREAPVRRALVFMLLHAFVVLPYGLGVIAGQRGWKQTGRPRDAATDGLSIELIGRSQRAVPELSPVVAVDQEELAS